eukprot:g7454.t2
MRDPLRWSGALLICLLQLSSTTHARQHSQPEEKDRSRRRKRAGVTEADEDAAFAAEMLGLVYDRVKDVGDVLRVVGDTAGGLAGGSFKLLSASVNGLSSVLDAASRGVKANIRTADERSSTSPTPPAAPSDKTRPSGAPIAKDGSSSSSSSNGGRGGARHVRGGGPDPFDRVGSVALTSLAGSLKILSTAVGGFGDAVFQAGMLAEGVAGGTGQVAEDTVRLLQSFVGWARDDMVKLNNRKPQDHESRKSFESPPSGKRSTATPSAPPEQHMDSNTEPGDISPSPAELPASTTVLEGLVPPRRGHGKVAPSMRLREEEGQAGDGDGVGLEKLLIVHLGNWGGGGGEFGRGLAGHEELLVVVVVTVVMMIVVVCAVDDTCRGLSSFGWLLRCSRNESATEWRGWRGMRGFAEARLPALSIPLFTGIFASDGLSSFVAEHLAEGLLEALEEMKPTSVVGVELLDVELGSTAPRILGIKTLDPTSSASPGWGDGRCRLEGKCVSLRVDLEVASQDLRIGVRVKASNLEKALLPTGTVRLLEFYFRGSVSVRAEIRDEFPFVSTAFVAFDYPPAVQVKLEQWGLDALTLGAVPAAVDEWARIALQQALAPYVLPGFMEVDAALALCPDCPARVPVASRTAVDEQQEKAGNDSRIPSSRRQSRKAVERGASSKMSFGKNDGSIENGNRRLGKRIAGSSYDDKKRGRPSVQDSTSLFSGAGAASGGVDAGEGGGRPVARKKHGVAGEQDEFGPAAAMVEKGGALRWLKQFNQGRGEFWDWEGLD